jgi:hypothetical protein
VFFLFAYFFRLSDRRVGCTGSLFNRARFQADFRICGQLFLFGFRPSGVDVRIVPSGLQIRRKRKMN